MSHRKSYLERRWGRQRQEILDNLALLKFLQDKRRGQGKVTALETFVLRRVEDGVRQMTRTARNLIKVGEAEEGEG
jgi:hypothetical protein